MSLQEVEVWLNEEEIETSLEDELLLIFLGSGDQIKEQILHLTMEEQILEGKEPVVLLEWVLPFAIEVKPEMSSDMAAAVCFINSETGFPGFEYLEADEKIRFRHTVLTGQNGLTKESILSVIGWIAAEGDLFAPMLIAIAKGEKTFKEILKDTLDAMDE